MKDRKRKGPGLFPAVPGIVFGLCLGSFVLTAQAAGSSAEYQRIAASTGKNGAAELRSELYSIYEDSKQSSPDEEETNIGPGGIQEVVDETGQTGPKLEDTGLSETYHEDFGIYEQNLKDTYFIYTTVANGGITDQSVAVDIPAGINYTMEKDGTEIPYASGQAVSERGTYVLRLTAVDDESLPFSEQTVYKAVFRFRIQERLVTETEAEEGELSSSLPESAINLRDVIAAEETEGWTYGNESGTGESGLGGDGNTADGNENGLNGDGSAADGSEDRPGENESEGLSDGSQSFIFDDGSYDQDAIDAMLDEVIGIGATEPENLENYNPGNGLAQTYDPIAGFYTQTLLTGSTFYTNVPNGMLTTQGVTIRNGNSDVAFTVYKDGEALEYTAGTELSEPGSYTVLAAESTTLFISGYSSETKPVFAFRILPEAVNDLGTVAAPEGMVIEEVLLENEPVSDAVMKDGRYARLTKDGTYTIWFSGEQGEVSVSFLLDRVSPRFYVQVEKNRAAIGWASSDTVRCEVLKDGTLQTTSGVLYEITGNGTYTFTAYDEAGNTGVSQFEIPFALNMAAIIGIVLIAALVIAAVFFVRNVNKKIKVR